VARRVTHLTYELGPAFWQYAEKAIHPQGGNGVGGGVEGGCDMGARGGGFEVRVAQGGGGGIGGGGGFGIRGAQGGGEGGGFRSRGPTRTMTAVGSLKATDYWDDRSQEGLAQWKALLQDAVRKGLARQVVSNFTYELGPEFWEAAEEAIHPGGRTRS
jgi:hypothetical protein